MKAEYRRDMKHNYLILESEDEEDIPEYCSQMLAVNQIGGLLSVQRSRINGILSLSYEVTGLQSIANLYEKKRLHETDILQILTGMEIGVESMREYLLSPKYLIFDPQFIFSDPGSNSIFFCYAPGMKHQTDISMLAEFILKRLDHQNADAVRLGYLFYEKVQEENFSLSDTLKVIVENGNSRTGSEEEENNNFRKQTVREIEDPLNRKDYSWPSNDRNEKSERLALEREVQEGRNSQERRYHDLEERINSVEKKGKDRKNHSVAAVVFERIHPAVLLSTLFLIALLEIIYYFGYLSLTEAGGCFFLLISVEIYGNSSWRRRKEEKEKEKARWVEEEEESEEYQYLYQEMYENRDVLMKEEEIAETRYLSESAEEQKMYLICKKKTACDGNKAEENPDICIDSDELIVGKLSSRCDIILKRETVSRIHAKLEQRSDRYYLRDMNSRNGTFLNDHRLDPQECMQFEAGDRISFADVEYLAVFKTNLPR